MAITAYRARTTGAYPITLDEVRQRSGVGFGDEPTPDVLDLAEVDAVGASQQPDYDPATHRVAEGAPEEEGGVWRQTWVVMGREPEPVIVPEIISDRQFAQILAIDGLITPEEALAWVGPGTIPAQLDMAVDQIPDEGQRFGARMLLTGATTFVRSNPFVSLLGQILQRDDAALDDIWTRAAAL